MPAAHEPAAAWRCAPPTAPATSTWGAAFTIAAGLEGVRGGSTPATRSTSTPTRSASEELQASGVHRLPATLGAALDAFEADALAEEVFGAEFHDAYARVKRPSGDEYNTVVGEWERERYLQLW